MKELNERTNNRIFDFRKAGFNVEYIWENEFGQIGKKKNK